MSNWILPEDADHPIRPNLPWFRHFTFAEGHSTQIGIAASILLYLSYHANVLGLGVFIVLMGVRVVYEHHRCKDDDTGLGHNFGLHDVASDPWYGVTSAIVTGIVLITVFGL